MLYGMISRCVVLLEELDARSGDSLLKFLCWPNWRACWGRCYAPKPFIPSYLVHIITAYISFAILICFVCSMHPLQRLSD